MIDADNNLTRDSILVSVKKIIGIDKNYDQFDNDIIMHINTVFMYLVQMGIGKPEFELDNGSQTWDEFLLDHQVNLRAIKTWTGLKVRLLFDPPTSSIHLQAINEAIKEAEWRMYITENYTDEDFNRHYYGVEYISDVGIRSGEVKQVAPYLFELEYSKLDYDFAEKYFKMNGLPIGYGWCSSVRNGNWYGRNFDWSYNDHAEFIVRTKNTIGISGQVPGMTNDFVKSGKYSEMYKLVPFMIVDGINKDGLICSTNVVPTDKGLTIGTAPNIEKKETLCSLMVPRYILDNFTTAKGAVAYLRDYVSVYMPKQVQQMGYETHFMIADENETYLIEFENNRLVSKNISTRPYITNFHLVGTILNPDGKVYTPADVPDGKLPSVINGITPHGSGLERYNLIVDNYQNADSKEGMFDLMKKLIYTNSYKESTDPYWYTEFVEERNLTVDSTPEEYQEIVEISQEAFRNRRRQGSAIETWQTCHMSIYDIENRSLYLVVQEYVNDVYEVKL